MSASSPQQHNVGAAPEAQLSAVDRTASRRAQLKDAGVTVVIKLERSGWLRLEAWRTEAKQGRGRRARRVRIKTRCLPAGPDISAALGDLVAAVQDAS